MPDSCFLFFHHESVNVSCRLPFNTSPEFLPFLSLEHFGPCTTVLCLDKCQGLHTGLPPSCIASLTRRSEQGSPAKCDNLCHPLHQSPVTSHHSSASWSYEGSLLSQTHDAPSTLSTSASLPSSPAPPTCGSLHFIHVASLLFPDAPGTLYRGLSTSYPLCPEGMAPSAWLTSLPLKIFP